MSEQTTQAGALAVLHSVLERTIEEARALLRKPVCDDFDAGQSVALYGMLHWARCQADVWADMTGDELLSDLVRRFDPDELLRGGA